MTQPLPHGVFPAVDGPAGRRATVTCPDCDVTWWGIVSDACWACGAVGRAVVGPTGPVRLPAV